MKNMDGNKIGINQFQIICKNYLFTFMYFYSVCVSERIFAFIEIIHFGF